MPEINNSVTGKLLTFVVFGNRVHYVQDCNIGDRLPSFPGTPEHVSFGSFRKLGRNQVINISSKDDEREKYTEEIVKKNADPVKLSSADKDIVCVDNILNTFSEVYKRNHNLYDYIIQIQFFGDFKDESLEGFSKRLVLLIEFSLATAIEEAGDSGENHFKTLSNKVIQRTKELVLYGIQGTLCAEKIQSVSQARDSMTREMRFLVPTRPSVDRFYCHHAGPVNYQYDQLRNTSHQPRGSPYNNYSSPPRQYDPTFKPCAVDTNYHSQINRPQSSNINLHKKNKTGTYIRRPKSPPPPPPQKQSVAGARSVPFHDESIDGIKNMKKIQEKIKDNMENLQDTVAPLSSNRTLERHRERHKQNPSSTQAASPLCSKGLTCFRRYLESIKKALKI